jgi:adenylyltransferase/sulfurtransferase
MDRYHRQQLLPQIKPEGQARLRASRVLLIGCGALGTVLAEYLTRAGIGALRLCDRDIVEETNLQRQLLFTQADADEGIPKAAAAATRLSAINNEVALDGRIVDVQSDNIESLIDFDGRPADLLLDGTDNADARYLVNDLAVKHSIPWVYGACIGVEGRVMPIWPGRSACLRCLFRDPPAPGELATCDTVGVLGPAAGIVASMQAACAIRMLVEGWRGHETLLSLDAWSGRFHDVALDDARSSDCPACGLRRFDFLNRLTRETARICGRNTVQVRPATGTAKVDLDQISSRLTGHAAVQRTAHLLRCTIPANNIVLTLFADGRALIHGTSDPARARSIYARYVGA